MKQAVWKLDTAIQEKVLNVLKKCEADPKYSSFKYLAKFNPARLICMTTDQSPYSRSVLRFSPTGTLPAMTNVKPIAQMRSLSRPMTLLTPYRYIFVVQEQLWNTLAPTEQEIVILRHLMSIDCDHEFNHPEDDIDANGRCFRPDVHEFQGFLDTFGATALSNPALVAG
jgi:hypothetical protein